MSRPAFANGTDRFAAPAIRELLYEQIPAERRRWLRRQIAESREGAR